MYGNVLIRIGFFQPFTHFKPFKHFGVARKLRWASPRPEFEPFKHYLTFPNISKHILVAPVSEVPGRPPAGFPKKKPEMFKWFERFERFESGFQPFQTFPNISKHSQTFPNTSTIRIQTFRNLSVISNLSNCSGFPDNPMDHTRVLDSILSNMSKQLQIFPNLSGGDGFRGPRVASGGLSHAPSPLHMSLSWQLRTEGKPAR